MSTLVSIQSCYLGAWELLLNYWSEYQPILIPVVGESAANKIVNLNQINPQSWFLKQPVCQIKSLMQCIMGWPENKDTRVLGWWLDAVGETRGANDGGKQISTP